MTERVDFYVINGAADKQRWTLACRLAEKAYLQGLEVVIRLETPGDARALDELLWTFQERSFVPHDLCVDQPFDPATPVHVALESAAVPAADLLVNLTDRLPADWDRYARVAEIVDGDAERRRLGRERFKIYRDSKVALDTHQLSDTAEP